MEEEGLDLGWGERQENACGILSFGHLHSKMETRTQAILCEKKLGTQPEGLGMVST